MQEENIQFRIALESTAEAASVAKMVESEGGQATAVQEKGLLPLGVLLAVVLPPGIALLAIVINRIVHSWKDGGVIVDARGTGAPIVGSDRSIPHGTIVILSRDGDQAKRTDLPDVDISGYIAAVLKALGGGNNAQSAKKTAESALAK